MKNPFKAIIRQFRVLKLYTKRYINQNVHSQLKVKALLAFDWFKSKDWFVPLVSELVDELCAGLLLSFTILLLTEYGFWASLRFGLGLSLAMHALARYIGTLSAEIVSGWRNNK